MPDSVGRREIALRCPLYLLTRREARRRALSFRHDARSNRLYVFFRCVVAECPVLGILGRRERGSRPRPGHVYDGIYPSLRPVRRFFLHDQGVVQAWTLGAGESERIGRPTRPCGRVTYTPSSVDTLLDPVSRRALAFSGFKDELIGEV